MSKFLDETGLATLWGLIEAGDTNVKNSSAQIVCGSYTGTGKYGASNPNTLTFPFKPKLAVIFMVVEPNGNASFINAPFSPNINNSADKYYTIGLSAAGRSFKGVKWSGNTVSWYHAEATNPATYQLNVSGNTYYYYAIT